MGGDFRTDRVRHLLLGTDNHLPFFCRRNVAMVSENSKRQNDMSYQAIAHRERPRLAGMWLSLTGLAWVAMVSSVAFAQSGPYHHFHSADQPPGVVGRGQLMRGGPLPGHYQPVQITAPEGAGIELATNGMFETTGKSDLVVGMLVGNVYRLKITNIPFRPGQEVFPSVEIINRLYPPGGDPARFPIPIELTREELELALRGQYVVRVIYLEDPQTALPQREDPEHQRYFDVGADQDPLQVADRLGRPMAILKLGSRVPDVNHTTGRFLFQSPPWIHLPEITTEPAAPAAEGESHVAHRTSPVGRSRDGDVQPVTRE
jgi:hypothetical protein